MNTLITYKKDDFVLDVNVTFPQGSVITSLTGATVEALVQRGAGPIISATSVTITGNTIRVAFADGTLDVGPYLFQVRVSIGGITQTLVSKTLAVNPSI